MCTLDYVSVFRQKQPLGSSHNFYLLVETMGSDSSHDSEKLTRFLETSMQKGLVENGALASSETEAKVWLLHFPLTPKQISFLGNVEFARRRDRGVEARWLRPQMRRVSSIEAFLRVGNRMSNSSGSLGSANRWIRAFG